MGNTWACLNRISWYVPNHLPSFSRSYINHRTSRIQFDQLLWTLTCASFPPFGSEPRCFHGNILISSSKTPVRFEAAGYTFSPCTFPLFHPACRNLHSPSLIRILNTLRCCPDIRHVYSSMNGQDNLALDILLPVQLCRLLYIYHLTVCQGSAQAAVTMEARKLTVLTVIAMIPLSWAPS
jgi:hypothetical protein